MTSGGETLHQAIDGHRPYLLRYARLHLSNPAQAEDAVQETLLAAIEGAERYAGRAALRTWLTGILKHKIIDQLRRNGREQALAADEDSENEAVEALFVADGHWRDPPRDWGDPAASLESRRFWRAFELCLERLPARTAAAFKMREVMELPTEEICKALDISTTNCWVMLHRARLTLRECLRLTWFENAP